MSAVGTILFIAQGGMRAKPDMKPWGNSKQQYYELRQGAALQREHLPYVSEVTPLKGLNESV